MTWKEGSPWSPRIRVMVPPPVRKECPDQEGKQKMLTPVDSLQDPGSRLFLLFPNPELQDLSAT